MQKLFAASWQERIDDNWCIGRMLSDFLRYTNIPRYDSVCIAMGKTQVVGSNQNPPHLRLQGMWHFSILEAVQEILGLPGSISLVDRRR
jgi:hypothetical protein